MQLARLVSWTLILVLVVICGFLVASEVLPSRVLGGAGSVSAHIVVDLLNLTHWTRGRVDIDALCRTIDDSAQTLRSVHSGRIMFVMKDPDSRKMSSDDSAALLKTAQRNRVYVYLVEQYDDPPRPADALARRRKTRTHSELGRDDFYMALLAARWRCAVLSEDRFRDLSQVKAAIAPFKVREFAFWRDLPSNDFVRTDLGAHPSIRRPSTRRYAQYGLRKMKSA